MTLQQQLDCARRELALRQRCYPGWVRTGKITAEKSAHEIGCIQAIVATLETVQMLNDAGLAWVIESQQRKETK